MDGCIGTVIFTGKRSPDDERQISRWMKTAGPKSRFRKALINLINKKKENLMIFQLVQKWDKRYSTGDID